MSAVRRIETYCTPFYVRPQNREIYFQRLKSNDPPTFNEDDIEKEIKHLCTKNKELKNDAIVYPYGYNNYKILISEPRHFPQILFGSYVGTDKSSYQSAIFEIKINHTPSQINNLTIDLLSRDGDLILTYGNHVIIPMTNSFHVVVDEERHQIDLFNYSLPVHKTCKDIIRNFINIKNHKKWLRIKFNDGKNEYVIKSPVFCLSSTCFRGPLKEINKNINSIKEMHALILAIIDNETIFRTGALRNSQEVLDELDTFILEAEESVSNIRPLQVDPLEVISASPEIRPIQFDPIKRPVNNYTPLRAIRLVSTSRNYTNKMIIPESALLVSRRWGQMMAFFGPNVSHERSLDSERSLWISPQGVPRKQSLDSERLLRVSPQGVHNIFTNTFLHSNVTKLFSSKYYGGIIDGISLLTKIKNSPGGYGTIFLSRTPYSNYIIWVIRTIDRNAIEIEGGEEGELVEIIPDQKCSVAFYIFNPKFEGMLDNMSRYFPNGSPFKTPDPEILIDTTPVISIDAINSMWEKEGIEPLIF